MELCAEFGEEAGQPGEAEGVQERLEFVPVSTAGFPAVARWPARSVLDKLAAWDVLGESAPHWRVALRAMLGQKAARG